MQICEMAAQNANMSHMHAMVTSENEGSHAFFSKKLKSYKPDIVSEYCGECHRLAGRMRV